MEDTSDEFSTYLHRQPEHIEIAGAIGLGEFEKPDVREFAL
jgi:hypothetical protein